MKTPVGYRFFGGISRARPYQFVMPNVYTKEDVIEHRKSNDVWVIIAGKVYDITAFLEEHPGGQEILMEQAGIDATNAFEDIGHSDEAKALLKDYYIGDLVDVKDPNSVNQPIKKKSSITAVLASVSCAVAVAAIAYHYVKGHH